MQVATLFAFVLDSPYLHPSRTPPRPSRCTRSGTTPGRPRRPPDHSRTRTMTDTPETKHATLRWLDGMRFEGGEPDGPQVVIDADNATAPGPMLQLLLAAASCAGADVVSILKKMQVGLESLEVRHGRDAPGRASQAVHRHPLHLDHQGARGWTRRRPAAPSTSRWRSTAPSSTPSRRTSRRAMTFAWARRRPGVARARAPRRAAVRPGRHGARGGARGGGDGGGPRRLHRRAHRLGAALPAHAHRALRGRGRHGGRERRGEGGGWWGTSCSTREACAPVSMPAAGWRACSRAAPPTDILVLLVGIESRPGGQGGWFVEAGIGGGARLAAGYRWRRLPPGWRATR